MATVEIKPATREDLRLVLENPRAEDALELLSLGETEVVLEGLLRESQEASVGYVDGVPACAFGYRRDTLMSYAVLWLATTPLVEQVPKTMARLSYDWVQSILRREGVLEGWALDRNTRSLRWLGWMGFRLSAPFHLEPVGLVRHFIKRL